MVNPGPAVMEPEEPPDPVDLGLLDQIECEPFEPVPSEARLLTRAQYNQTVRDLFGVEFDQNYAADFPHENTVQGFLTNARFHRASPLLAERHMTAAEVISDEVVARLSTLLPCSEMAEDAACAEQFIDEYGPRVFRRPFLDGERQAFVDLYTDTAAQHGFAEAVRLITQALLQSPQFLYRLEFAGTEVPGTEAFELSDYEMASRLSYFLWNSMPDDELFELAGRGELHSLDQVEAAARRMVESPRADATIRDFWGQWLRLERLNGASRDLDGTPTNHSWAWRSSLELFSTHVFRSEEANLRTLFLSPTVFVNDELSTLYGGGVESGNESQFVAVELDPGQRAGLLSQPGLMALYAHPTQSAPIQRGVFVRNNILCQPPPAPPPDVDNNPPDPDPSLTTRERFSVHTEDPQCAGCHQLIDPLGLSFESFDHLGRYRSQENGLAVDDSGAVVGTREQAIQGPYDGVVELSERLAESRQVAECLVSQWYRYGVGRVEQEVDLCSIRAARDLFEASGNSLPELLVGIAVTDAFRFRGTEPEGAAP